MNFNDVKLLLPASGYMKTSDDGGRTVIDEMRDASYERNHQTFVGADRPELNETLDGNHQVSVEKEVANLLPDGQAQQADPSLSGWSSETIAPELNYDTVLGYNISRHQAQGVANNSYFTHTVPVPLSGNTAARKINYSFIAKNNGGAASVRVLIRTFGGSAGNAFILVSNSFDLTDEYKEYSFDAEIVESDRTSIDLRIQQMNGDGVDIDAVIGLHLPIESAYPTLFTEGTRLAPSAVIQNALPETGTVAGVVDMVRDDSNNQHIFINTSFTPDNISQLTFRTEGTVRFNFHGFDDASILIPWNWNNFTRKKISYIGTTNGTERKIWFLVDGNIHSTGHSRQTTDSTNRNIILSNFSDGNRATSTRFEKPFYKDNIVRVNATDDEIKAFFETLTKGTSMETAKEDMAIV